MNQEIRYSVSTRVNAPASVVWEILCSPSTYHTAWNAELATRWVKGAPIGFSGMWEDQPYQDKGIVLEISEERLVEFSYWSSFWEAPDIEGEYSTIRYELEPIDTCSCGLTVMQRGFRDDIHYQETVILWNDTINIMKQLAEKSDLRNRISATFGRLAELIGALSPEAYNRRVASKWTVGQLVEHVIMSNAGFMDFLTGNAAASSRNYAIHVPEIRTLMSNQAVGLQAPEFLIPSAAVYETANHLSALHGIRDELLDCTELDLTQICNGIDMPPFGVLTFFEWLTFAVFHTERHRQQVESRI
jgi:hypothetical protein